MNGYFEEFNENHYLTLAPTIEINLIWMINYL